MSKREVRKNNKEKFPAWKSMMKLYPRGLGDHAQSTITIEHVDLVGAPAIDDMKKNK